MTKRGFKKEFLWGVASAAYQIEGAFDEDGKELSIWDELSMAGKIRDGSTGNVACDFYHRYEEDIALVADLGVDVYRISVSMPRIINRHGEVNEAGIDFYNKVINSLIERGVTPYITLYHWDLPAYLHERGGFLNRELITAAFENYATVVAERFGDRVKNFITFNEPWAFISSGYVKGRHAPCLQLDVKDTLALIHNVLLCHGLMVRAIRSAVPDARVGMTTSSLVACPTTESSEDVEIARSRFFAVEYDGTPASTVANYLDPIYFGSYPRAYYEKYADVLPEIREGDMKIISEPTDFIGHNIYTGYKIGVEGEVKSFPTKQGASVTANNWEVMPESLYWGIKFIYERYKKPIIVTENGVAMCDVLNEKGEVRDECRIDFLSAYLRALKRAADEGVELDGYFHWSFCDNLEWTGGYRYRFGLVYIDYQTQKRIPKHSYYWYRRLVKSNGKIL